MRGVTKHFGNLEALSSVSFRLRQGTLHALLGENGAGKTTLMRIAFGMIPADTGEIRVGGVPRKIRSPRNAITLGIEMVHQHFMLVPEMTVTENLELGGHERYDAHVSAQKLKLLEAKTGLQLDPSVKVSSLGVPAQQRLKIMKALSHDAQVLILDEPTVVLAPGDVHDLLERIHDLVLDGMSVVLITHKLGDAQQYADDVSVLRHGKLVVTGSMTDFTERELAATMLGHDPAPHVTHTHKDTVSVGESVISLRRVGLVDSTGIRRFQNMNLDVRAGEIVGIAALEGSAAMLLQVLAGSSIPTEGECLLPSPIGFIAEDRQHDALVGPFTLSENVALKESGRLRAESTGRQSGNKLCR